MQKLLLVKKMAVLMLLTVCVCFTNGQKQKVWLDADTGNETDDVYAIVRLLQDTSVEVVGLSSAHFNNADLVAFDKWNQYPAKGINTVKISQQLNEEILTLSGKLSIPHPLGADRQMGRAWGGSGPRSSAASQQLIATIKSLAPQEKLVVICLGALTNLASAISFDSTIAKRITCYLLGARYNAGKRFWDKNEFNIRNDLNAFDYLLNNPAVDLTIMPITTAVSFRFQRDSLYAIFNDSIPVLYYLKQRWKETNPDDRERTLWDVSLIETFLRPGLATISQASTPAENLQRTVKVYTSIEVDKMKDDYIKSIKKFYTVKK